MGTIYTPSALLEVRTAWRAAGKAVVFTNGCYDLLHAGHIRLLEKARTLGDVLILALNTDASVSRLKGPTRPLPLEPGFSTTNIEKELLARQPALLLRP
jgi:cytidyltransferase-like protein